MSTRYLGRQITVIPENDEQGPSWSALIDGAPAVRFSPTPKNAISIAKLVIEGELESFLFSRGGGFSLN